MKNVSHREKCPKCNGHTLRAAFYKTMCEGKQKWATKDVMICTTDKCDVVLSHSNRTMFVIPIRSIQKSLGLDGPTSSVHVFSKPRRHAAH